MLGAESLRTAYAACDLYVSASTCETLGNTVVEAWSCGTPVAVQAFGGHLEFVKEPPHDGGGVQTMTGGRRGVGDAGAYIIYTYDNKYV